MAPCRRAAARGYNLAVRCCVRSVAVFVLALSALLGADRPARKPPAETETKTRVEALVKQADAAFAGRKYADAERELTEASKLEPYNTGVLYKLATARAKQPGKAEPAVDALTDAVLRGFIDFPLMTRDPALAPLRENPGFKRLIERKDFYLRRTAEGTLAALRNRFGDDGYQYLIDDDARLVFCVAMDEATLTAMRAELRAQRTALEAELFEHKPDAYVTVLMPTAKEYGKMVRFRNVPGLYADDIKSLVARERGYVMAHEFTHALHAADLAPSGQHHAMWVAEGLGAMCESWDFSDGVIHPRENPRFSAMPAAARRKGVIPLERLVTMKQSEFISRPGITYPESAYLMLYLWEKGLLRKFYDAYKRSYDADPTGRSALEEVTGQKLPELHETFRLWLGSKRGAGG
jgi:hypothetical protein